MEAEQSHMTEVICDLALEIICMLTGEKYAAVKMASIEGLLGGMYPPLSLGGSLSQAPIIKSPSHSRKTENNNQKILELTNKIIELLVGEVSGVKDSGTFIEEGQNIEKDHLPEIVMEDQALVTSQSMRLSFPVEEKINVEKDRLLDTIMEDWGAQVTSLGVRLSFPVEEKRNIEKDHLQDTVMEDQGQVTSAGGSSEGIPPERSSHSSHSQDSTQEIPHHLQVSKFEQNIKMVKEESEEVDVRVQEPCTEEEPSSDLPMGSSLDVCGSPHHDQVSKFEQNIKMVKEESEELDVRVEERCTEEEPSSDLPMGSSLDVCGSPHHDQDTNLAYFKQEEEEDVWSGKQYREEESSSQSTSDWGHTQDPRQQPLDIFFFDGMKSEFNITTDSSNKAFPILQSVPTQKEPYSCFVCGKCFKFVSELTIHQRSHTGEKPYSCSDCGKHFSQIGNLNAHRIIHTGQKPFSCSECGKCFSLKSSLFNHWKIHNRRKGLFAF